jgi:hypothetical protein
VCGRQPHPGLQLADDAGHVLEPCLHGGGVLGEHPLGDGGVAGLDDLPHPVEGHVEGSEPLDDGGVGQLRGVIAAVAGGGVDPGRDEDAGLVVRPERLDRQQARSRERADRHQSVVHD